MTQQQNFEDITTELYYGGASHSAVNSMEIHDPAEPRRVVGWAAAASRDQALESVSAARAAQLQWSTRTPAERAALLQNALSALEEHLAEDAQLLSQENGKIVQESTIDLIVFSHRVRLACGLADRVDENVVLPGPPVETTVRYRPLGVVTVIVPFNWPLAILGASLPYALIAGNTAVVKPPPSTPLAVTRVVQRFAQQLPPGVLNVVTGEDAEIGEALVSNPDVAKVCFTGSVGGGRRIMEMASRTLTRVALELGGNDAALILADAVLDDDALDRLYHGIFDSTGQVCMAAKRLYVHRARFDEVVAGLSLRLERTVLGRGTDPGTTMGPLHTAAQLSHVRELVEEARRAGAEVLEFGNLPEGELAEGHFVRPSLVLHPDPSSRVVTEEQFGPIIPLMVFDDTDDAVNAANDTWAGLCASVWTADEATAAAVGSQLVAGYVFHNTHGAALLDERAPFGGLKSSGMGREMGLEGLREFMDTHSLGILKESAAH